MSVQAAAPGAAALPESQSAEGADAADWPGAEKFSAVQDMLDRNAVLIKQINDNHSMRTPDALQRNVLLIRELNSNVQRIVGLYQDLADVLGGVAPTAAAAAAGGGAGPQEVEPAAGAVLMQS
eukprot:gene4686-biopygen6440